MRQPSTTKPFSEHTLPVAQAQRLALARKLATLMDTAFTIPGINKKVGLDPLLGLVPVAGDVVALGISLFIVYLGRQMGMSRFAIARMLFNVALDSTVGTVPLAGDAFDVFFKGNMRNLRLMEKYAADPRNRERLLSPVPAFSAESLGRMFKGLTPSGLGSPVAPSQTTIDVPAGHRQTDKS